MSTAEFFKKLAFAIGPFVAIFALPIALLVRSAEIAPIEWVAMRHATAPSTAVYGPAYSNPDKGYKLASLALRKAPLTAIGTSRVMQFQADFFVGGEATFYNAGGIATRLFDYRILFEKMGTLPTRKVILGLDPWMFNEGWPDFGPDPGVVGEYEREYSTLDVIQRSLRVYPDLRAGRFTLGTVFGANDSFGLNGMSRGNGFRRDGSYQYADILRAPASAEDFEFRDTLERVRTGTRRFEPGDAPSPRALAELELLTHELKALGFEVVAFIAPLAPTVADRMRTGGRHALFFRLGHDIAKILAMNDIEFVDFTSCAPVGCADTDFIDGFHGGPALYARLLEELGHKASWLAPMIDTTSLERRLALPRETWTLSP